MGRKGLKCLGSILAVFAGLYMGLVGVYRWGTLPTALTGILLLILGIWLLFLSIKIPEERKRNYYGIFSGLFLWGFLGEVMERLGIIEIASWQMFPLLGLFTFFIILFGVKRYLPTGPLFCVGHFNAIWFLHFVMINQFELMGRTSWITYLSCGIFSLMAIFSGYRMIKTKTDTENMAYALALLLLGWSALEYIWGWRLLPGPWMLK